MRNLLWKAMGREHVFWHGEDGLLNEVIKEQGQDYFRKFAIIGGHFRYSDYIYHQIPTPRVFATIIRDPVAQLVSHFEFITQRPEHGLFSGLTLEQTLQQDTLFSYESFNMQCRHLSTQGTAEDALANIQQNSLIVGCTEHIDLFITYLSQLFNWPTLQIPRENQQTPGYFERHYTPHAAELIADITSEDQKLYEHIRQTGLIISPKVQ